VSLEEAFLRDIVEHPDDDAPRLAYADWLQEQADSGRQARGEFIAVQCAVRRDEERGQFRKEMKKRQRELFLQHRAAWLPETTVTGPRHKIEYSRGFVESVQLDGDAHPLDTFLDRVRELFRREPAIRRLCVAPAGAERHSDLVPQLVRLPEMPRVIKLVLDANRLGVAQARALGAPSLRGLRRLLLSDNPLGDEGAAALADLESLSNLEALALANCQIQNVDGTLPLSRSPHLRRLLYLGLGSNELRGWTLRGLARASGLDALKTLSLASCAIDEDGACALTAGPLLARLPKLDIARNQLGDVGAAVLARSPHLAGVRDLNLGWNQIGNAGLVALAGSPHAGGLEVLAVPGNPFGLAGSHALATSPFLGRLRALHLVDNGDWDTEKIIAFLQAARLPALVELNLNGYARAATVLPALLRSPLVRQLRSLRMNGGGTDESGKLLLESPAVASLEDLELSSRYFGSAMWQALKEYFGDRLRH
jgi:uncharacterized protein (TIGR02996 family)